MFSLLLSILETIVLLCRHLLLLLVRRSHNVRADPGDERFPYGQMESRQPRWLRMHTPTPTQASAP